MLLSRTPGSPRHKRTRRVHIHSLALFQRLLSTGCSQERWGEGEQPGQTYLLVHVWVKGTVLSEKHKVPCRSFSLYPSWKNTYLTIGERRANCMVLRTLDPWQPGEESNPQSWGRGVKLQADQKSPANGGGTDSLNCPPSQTQHLPS